LAEPQISGALLAFDHRLADQADGIDRTSSQKGAGGSHQARARTRPAHDEEALAPITGVDEVLAGAACMLSTLWLDDVLRRALNPTLPDEFRTRMVSRSNSSRCTFRFSQRRNSPRSGRPSTRSPF
jgi:hypothetical protein